jgi:hypothetical protein
MLKKIFCLTFVFIFFPFAIYALEMITDDELESLTGAAGVSVQLYGNVEVKAQMTKMGWGDRDGIAGYTEECFFVLEASGSPSKTTMTLKSVDPLFTLDIGTTDSSPYLINGKTAVNANSTFILINIPDDITAEIIPCQFTDLKLTGNPVTGENSKSFGRLETHTLKISIPSIPSKIYISAH